MLYFITVGWNPRIAKMTAFQEINQQKGHFACFTKQSVVQPGIVPSFMINTTPSQKHVQSVISSAKPLIDDCYCLDWSRHGCCQLAVHVKSRTNNKDFTKSRPQEVMSNVINKMTTWLSKVIRVTLWQSSSFWTITANHFQQNVYVKCSHFTRYCSFKTHPDFETWGDIILRSSHGVRRKLRMFQCANRFAL